MIYGESDFRCQDFACNEKNVGNAKYRQHTGTCKYTVPELLKHR